MAGEIRGCIDEAAAAGAVDPDLAQDLRDTFDDVAEAMDGVFPTEEALRAADEAVMKKLDAEAIEARRLRQQSVRARRQLLEGIAQLKQRRGYNNVRPLPGRGGSGRPPKGGWVQGGEPPENGRHRAVFARALELLVENKPGLAGGPFPSIEGRYRALRGQFDAHMASVIEAFEAGIDANLFHKRGRATLENLVREAFGEDTGDVAAKALAKAWADTAEKARLAFNAAGGAIGKLDGWGMPQLHDPFRIREAGKDAWVEAVLPRLDRSKMIDEATGQPFTERRLRAVLGRTWERIASGGAVDRKPGEFAGNGMLAKSRREERFLIFKSADDWMAYQEAFGEADAFAAMMGHLDDMARDIAQMQILGPNPAHQWEWLKRAAQHEADIEEARGVKGAQDKAKSYIKTADDMLLHFTGAAATPVNTRFAQVGASSRAYLTAVSLGAAIVSDLPSAPYFGALARIFSGLDRKGDLTALVKLIASPEQRQFARRSGFIIEQATDGFVRATHDNLRLATVGERVTGEGNAFMRRIPAAVIRAQGLTGWTAARKRAFRFEFMGALADKAGKSLADLARSDDAEDRAFAQLLEARGFTEAEWGVIRQTAAWEPKAGARFLRPMDVADQELALRLAETIEMQTRMAVPETSLWTRAKLIGERRPGTVLGEALRGVAMFKSFTLTAMHVFLEEMALRSWASANPVLAGVGHAAHVLAFLTIAGAVSIQLRELTKGNTPRHMDEKFWGAAMMQGGGLGLFGDFLYAAKARNGKSAGIAALGPPGQAAADLWEATGGNVGKIVSEMAQGESLGEAVEAAEPGEDLAQLVRIYSPVSSLWWARTAWSRGVADQLQKALDPDAEEDFRKRAKRLEERQGSQQWWDEGELVPSF